MQTFRISDSRLITIDLRFLLCVILSLLAGPISGVCADEEVTIFKVKVLRKYPHDPKAFTQGLCIHNGYLYESTGLYGESSLRKIDLNNQQIVEMKCLSDTVFAEGIALVGSQLIQVTWREQTAFVYDLNTFDLHHIHHYQGEGWGLCSDGRRIFMTNGTDLIVVRDAKTFDIRRRYPVTLGKHHLSKLNAMTCVGNALYANIWHSHFIIKIDKRTGCVTGIVDASNLLTPEEQDQVGHDGVLNGIAYFPERKTFFLTGKNWPWMFEVHFIPTSKKRSSLSDV